MKTMEAVSIISISPLGLLSTNKAAKGVRKIYDKRGNRSETSWLAIECLKHSGSSSQHHKLCLNPDTSPSLLRNFWLSCFDAPFKTLAAYPVVQSLSSSCQTWIQLWVFLSW